MPAARVWRFEDFRNVLSGSMSKMTVIGEEMAYRMPPLDGSTWEPVIQELVVEPESPFSTQS
jgi:hypothetical protein